MLDRRNFLQNLIVLPLVPYISHKRFCSDTTFDVIHNKKRVGNSVYFSVPLANYYKSDLQNLVPNQFLSLLNDNDNIIIPLWFTTRNILEEYHEFRSILDSPFHILVTKYKGWYGLCGFDSRGQINCLPYLL